ncbi:hypothetical protein [Bosea sp. (in: a-proteobacteria)]|jgi:hypothetical protein|uniref:hypothetical protein n=1 Tax=Bosea sp. (in: a-proteobacteria) TaxID=1871050 RepID=UPI0035614C4B
MSAHAIYDHAPIGSIISWSDVTPRPPERFIRNHAVWLTSNGRGRLIRKQPSRSLCNLSLSASFTLHEANFGTGGVVAIRVHRTFSLDSTFHFSVVERPAIGLVRVFDRAGDDAVLVHFAPNLPAAKEWLSGHGYPQAVLQEVTADEVGAAVVEGRAA